MIAATISGNLGSDAKLGDAGGTPVANFSVASRRFEKGEEKTDWVGVAFFGQRATKLAQYLTKGSKVCVRGSLHVREYTKKDGAPGYELSMRADDIELMGGKSDVATTNGSAVPRDEIPF